MTKMEDDQNGRRPKWKMTKTGIRLKLDNNGRHPKKNKSVKQGHVSVVSSLARFFSYIIHKKYIFCSFLSK